MNTKPVYFTTRARTAPVLLSIVAAITVVACGGGGGGGYAAPPPPPPPPAGSGYTFKSLVVDQSGSGTAATAKVDADLLNPWGIVFGGTFPVWTSNNHSNTSTLYDGNGNKVNLTVHLPPRNGDPNQPFNPTGIVYNGVANEFMIGETAASFIYSGEGGMIAGWPGTGDAIITYTDNSPTLAVYKGLALASNGTADFLYATDFANNKVDVFDSNFKKMDAATFPFVDPALPTGYAPFGIQAIKNGSGGTWQLYVAYALQQSGNTDNATGAGEGVIDIFDPSGKFVKRLVSNGGTLLNAPWGLALAPSDFGSLSNMLLVGNFGDGKINAFDPASGQFKAALADGSGAAFSVPGLWGIAFGNDGGNDGAGTPATQPHNTLFYAAGPGDEAHGDYGRIDVGTSGSTSPNAPGY